MLDFKVTDDIAWLTLQRPAALNAINRDLANAFYNRIQELEHREDVRVVITRGAGRAFCAGSDVRELSTMSAEEATRNELRFAEIFAALGRLPQPTIAVLHGHVLGGGLGLAVYHDFRIASVTASLGMPEVELGWIPPWSVGRLAEIVGLAKARWLLLTCSPITGNEAAKIGLVDQAVPEDQLETCVQQLATRLSAMPSEGIAQTKGLLNRMSPLRDFQWDELASAAFRHCYSTDEAQKRIGDFTKNKTTR